MNVAGTSAAAPEAPRLTWARMLGYGVGDGALNLFFTTATLFLLFYYTDILGLSPAVAGWVFAGALVWDALFDPWMGYIANRTRTRWGRYRPYILFGAVPLAASWTLMFLPTGFTGGALILFAVATHILFRTVFAVVGMPFVAMSAALTRNSSERGTLAGVRMMAGATAGLFGAVTTLALVDRFGGGQTGFFWTAVVYGVLATIILLIVFASTHEIVADVEEERPAARAMIAMLARNRAFWILAAASLTSAIGSTFFQKTLPYFLKYQLHREDLISPALGLLAGSVLFSIPFWTWLAARTSKRTMWLAGMGVGFVAFALLWFLPPAVGTFLPILVVVGISAGAGFLGFWGMMPDTVEYGEWRSGIRAEGAVFGFATLIQKGGLGLAAAVLGEALSAIGYRANVAQTPDTLAAMRTLMIVVPVLFSIATAAVIAFYPLDHARHARIVRMLAYRRVRRDRIGALMPAWHPGRAG